MALQSTLDSPLPPHTVLVLSVRIMPRESTALRRVPWGRTLRHATPRTPRYATPCHARHACFRDKMLDFESVDEILVKE